MYRFFPFVKISQLFSFNIYCSLHICISHYCFVFHTHLFYTCPYTQYDFLRISSKLLLYVNWLIKCHHSLFCSLIICMYIYLLTLWWTQKTKLLELILGWRLSASSSFRTMFSLEMKLHRSPPTQEHTILRRRQQSVIVILRYSNVNNKMSG